MINKPFGKPGLPANWSVAQKQCVGTDAGDVSKVWFTVARGIVTEVYYPTVDVANTRDLQFLVADGKGFFEEESKDTHSRIEYINERALAFKITNISRSGKYSIIKNILTDPSDQSLFVNTTFKPLSGYSKDFKLYILFAPHVKNRGSGNHGKIIRIQGMTFLIAWREDIWAAITATIPFKKASAGYAGFSDGWQDISRNHELTTEFDSAEDGNIALTAEVDISKGMTFNLTLSFGRSESEAIISAISTLKRSYKNIERRYIAGWHRYLFGLQDMSKEGFDGGRLYRISAMVLKAHEDKTQKGAVAASLSVPWGEQIKDDASGGYHLIWPRDLCKIGFGFMAMGDMKTPTSIIEYLRSTQKADGSWPQNFWIDGRPYWNGIQLDEVAFPVILAWRLKKMGLLIDDFYPMVKKAASFLVREGPITEQERWEENTGFSPSTIAVEITALVCAACWAKENGDEKESRYLFEIADYWATKIEDWTFTNCGCIYSEYPEHYQRISSFAPEDLEMEGLVCELLIPIKNIPDDAGRTHRQCAVIDGGFLELVRYGLRHPKDTHVLKTLPVIDRLLRVETNYGTSFHRYNNDAYGEKNDGSPYDGTGVGRAWPLLTGERGMYEFLSGNDITPYIKAIEGFANEGGMIPEQIWDEKDIPEKGLFNGKGTGSATPLVWAHAEYIKLLRSKKYDMGCDIVPEVYQRYVENKTISDIVAYKVNKPVKRVSASNKLRIVSHEEASLLWTKDAWKTKEEVRMVSTGLGLYYHDFKPYFFEPGTILVFTFHYADDKWEGKDYNITIM